MSESLFVCRSLSCCPLSCVVVITLVRRVVIDDYCLINKSNKYRAKQRLTTNFGDGRFLASLFMRHYCGRDGGETMPQAVV